MRFGLVHRVMTDALAALGVLALVASGQFNRAVNIAVVIGLALAISMRESWRHEAGNKHVDTIAVFALIAAQLGRAVFTGPSILDLLIEFAVGLQIIRVATRKGAAHDQQVIVLALLHLIAGTVVGGGLGYGLCFFGLLVVTPGALVLSHLRREVEGNYRQGARDRTGLPVDVPRILRSKRVVGRQFIAVTCLLSVPILLFTVALFIVFPRVGLSLLLLNKPRGGRMIGFSGKVDLGQIGTLRTDNTIAIRITVPNLPDPPPMRRVMHLRGTGLDHYDGRTWTQSQKQSRMVATGGEVLAIRALPEIGTDPMIRMELEAIDPPVLFLPPDTKGMRLLRTSAVGPGASVSIQRGPEGEYRYQAPSDRGVHYEVFTSPDHAPAFATLPNSQRTRYLQLPGDMTKRIRELAVTWTEGKKTDFGRAKAIERKLRTEFRYDLSSPSGKFDQPLDHFLFESKAGHCEYYSTAMAVMLRVLDIPSRNVTGFVGGTYNKFGQFYAVRQGDAHSWVEGYIDGRGWLTFDPTPPAAAVPQSDIDGMLAELRMFFEAVSQSWNHHVLGYDLRQQVGLFESLSSRNRGIGSLLRKPSSRSMLLATGLLILLACAYWLYRRRRHRLQEGDDETTEKTKDAALATSLYQALDVVMIALGIARSSSTPPLRHAEVLTGSGHPDADLIMQLTMRYLDARFGRHPLTAQDRQAFESGMRRLKEQGSGKPRSGRGSATPKAARLQTGEAQPDDEAQTDEAQTAPTSGTRHSMPPDDARDEATRQSGEVLTHPPRHDDDEPPSDEGA